MVDVRISTGQAPAGRLRRRRQGRRYYLWDSRLLDAAHDELFEPTAWAVAGRLAGAASGRGTAHFLQPARGAGWVLRHSRRGGLVASFIDDAYLWLGRSRCRVFREFRLLAQLRKRGLPVPEPVAARVCRRGLIYTGDLITVRIPDARPLAERLGEAALPPGCWRDIGAAIARFHQAGVYHHDLNARNVLVAADGAITLIDFDKSALREPGAWRRHNLARLRRSLDKIAAERAGLHFGEHDWTRLQCGYDNTKGE